MRQSTAPNYFAFVSNLMNEFRLPELDFAAVLEARRKDLDALVAVNRLQFKGLETVALKHAEVVRHSLQDLHLIIQQLLPRGGSAKRAHSNKTIEQALQTAFRNVRELADAAQKPQYEVFDIVRRRVEQNIGQLKDLVRPRV
jgi:phasin family protein